MLQRYR